MSELVPAHTLVLYERVWECLCGFASELDADAREHYWRACGAGSEIFPGAGFAPTAFEMVGVG